MSKPTHIRVPGTSRSLCGNATIRSTFVHEDHATCRACRTRQTVADESKPRGRVQLTTGVEAEREAREAGITAERARVVGLLREAAARYPDDPTDAGDEASYKAGARDALVEMAARVEAGE